MDNTDMIIDKALMKINIDNFRIDTEKILNDLKEKGIIKNWNYKKINGNDSYSWEKA